MLDWGKMAKVNWATQLGGGNLTINCPLCLTIQWKVSSAQCENNQRGFHLYSHRQLSPTLLKPGSQYLLQQCLDNYWGLPQGLPFSCHTSTTPVSANYKVNHFYSTELSFILICVFNCLPAWTVKPLGQNHSCELGYIFSTPCIAPRWKWLTSMYLSLVVLTTQGVILVADTCTEEIIAVASFPCYSAWCVEWKWFHLPNPNPDSSVN